LKKKWLAVLVAVCVVSLVSTAIVLAIAPKTLTVPTTGIIVQKPDPQVNLGIYSDLECTEELTQIVWGEIVEGSTTNVTVYIKNECTLQLTLFQNTTNWIPVGASSDVTFGWDYTGDPIGLDSVEEIILGLAVDSESIFETFSFDLEITAYGT